MSGGYSIGADGIPRGQLWPTPENPWEIIVALVPRPGNAPFKSLRPDPLGGQHCAEGGPASTVWTVRATVAAKSSPPHFNCGPATPSGKGAVMVLRPLGKQAAALRWDYGSDPNHDFIQIEAVANSSVSLWRFSEQTFEAVARVYAMLHREGIVQAQPALDFPEKLDALPAAVANYYRRVLPDHPKRNGWAGHVNVARGNSHWDPGSLEYHLLFARALELLEEEEMDPRYTKLLDALLEMPAKDGSGPADPQFVGKRIVDATLASEAPEAPEEPDLHHHVAASGKPTGPPVEP